MNIIQSLCIDDRPFIEKFKEQWFTYFYVIAFMVVPIILFAIGVFKICNNMVNKDDKAKVKNGIKLILISIILALVGVLVLWLFFGLDYNNLPYSSCGFIINNI